MPKRSLKTRILQLRVITCIFFILSIKAVLLFFANYGVYKYPHIPAEVLETQLYKQRSPKLVLHKSKPDCKYDEILGSTSSLLNWEVPRRFDDFSAQGLVNGSYAPEHCNALFSVAVVVAYRNRQSQLDIFLPYMHNFLRKQNIHYRIYVVEQQDEKIFNKGILYNVGAKTALGDQFPCLILHDVDLLPLDAANLYACAASPRHMSASIDKFRFVLPYDYLTGGVLALKAQQFVAVNGFSNRFEGWGGEDDDFSYRLAAHKLDVVRFPVAMSRYTMLEHPQERRNSARLQILRDSIRDGGARDGLSTLPPVHVRVATHRLFTLVGVRL
ncbi:hypothetical protein PYW07_017505 [Mythimna separata]|uniref:Beta-1,4-N-acetylgalactosaminyltransferase n=1 Tax=Mythimna separata TaxID=271217 RepID=A0AAD7YVD7_MYTSE|nr:hypothetical protein PYW07_017505 [Mythimna separata]